MLIAVIIALVIFGVVRFLAPRFSSSRFSAVYGIAAAVIFFVGVAEHAAMHRSPTIVDVPAPTAAAPGASQAANPSGGAHKLMLTPAQISALTPTSGTRPLGSLDALTSSVAEMANTTNNTFADGTPIYVRGWAGDASKTSLPGVVLVVDFKRVINATTAYGMDRPDVARAYASPAMEYTGFGGVIIPTAGMKKGNHMLALAAIDPTGKHYVLTASVVKFTLN